MPLSLRTWTKPPEGAVEVRIDYEHRVYYYYVLWFEGEIIIASYCDGYLWESVISDERKKKILAMAACSKLGLRRLTGE